MINEIVGIQGVFQDINAEKLKELSLEKSLRIIESQNSKLLNFAHIVSHNLRSHASNLHLTLELLSTIDNPNLLNEFNGETILVTGAAGFIGSVVASALNKAGREDLILVDDFSKIEETGEAVYREIPSLMKSTTVTDKYYSVFEWIKIFDNFLRFQQTTNQLKRK